MLRYARGMSCLLRRTGPHIGVDDPVNRDATHAIGKSIHNVRKDIDLIPRHEDLQVG